MSVTSVLTKCQLLLLVVTSLVYVHQAEAVTYVRWGRTVCPCGAEKVYQGYVGGSFYTEQGGSSDYICLPDQPLWSNYSDLLQTGRGYVYGGEYQIDSDVDIHGAEDPLIQHDPPCVVCRSPRYDKLVIPARNECYPGWTKEYSGYLVSERSNSEHHRTQYICLDENPEVVPGKGSNTNGVLLYLVEAKCGALPCPPYVANRELSCVTCTI